MKNQRKDTKSLIVKFARFSLVLVRSLALFRAVVSLQAFFSCLLHSFSFPALCVYMHMHAYVCASFRKPLNKIVVISHLSCSTPISTSAPPHTHTHHPRYSLFLSLLPSFLPSLLVSFPCSVPPCGDTIWRRLYLSFASALLPPPPSSYPLLSPFIICHWLLGHPRVVFYSHSFMVWYLLLLDLHLALWCWYRFSATVAFHGLCIVLLSISLVTWISWLIGWYSFLPMPSAFRREGGCGGIQVVCCANVTDPHSPPPSEQCVRFLCELRLLWTIFLLLPTLVLAH